MLRISNQKFQNSMFSHLEFEILSTSRERSNISKRCEISDF